jgi:Fucose permease
MILLLIVIYLAFISLGMPHSIIGSAWPSMYVQFGVDISAAGLISMIITGCTVISSFFSDKLANRLKTSVITLISVAATAFALLGISFSRSLVAVCILAVPLGLGSGLMDAVLNNFVALHYKASHMNWLHAFWGVGASIGPIILSFFLLRTGRWETGYRAISIIQFALIALLFVTIPLWKKIAAPQHNVQINPLPASKRKLLALPGAKATLFAFFCYCGVEVTVGLWGSSYLVIVRGIEKEVAAGWISLFYFGITFGRILSGFLVLKLSARRMIFIGYIFIAAGIAAFSIPFSGVVTAIGLFLIGTGCGPVIPCTIHETPNNFGKENSQALIGMQMSSTFLGGAVLPPLFGVLGSIISYSLLPLYLCLFLVIMGVMFILVYKKTKPSKR